MGWFAFSVVFRGNFQPQRVADTQILESFAFLILLLFLLGLLRRS